MSSAAIAAAAMAALTASQAPGIELARPSGEDDAAKDSMLDLPPGDDSYHTELPPLRTPAPPEDDGLGTGGLDESGIPATVLAAYQKAERSLGASDPGCNLSWELLAAIGKVESGQARGGAVDDAGTTLRPILGPQLDGEGFARIEDTDDGAYDGDNRFDRAVGPLQFIPSTWARWGADGNGDGRKDPDNVFDAALAAGAYLCHGERDLTVKADLDEAILSYNHSQDYLETVLAWLQFYREGVYEVPDGAGVRPTSPGAGSDDAADDRGGTPKDENGDGDGRQQTDDPPASGGGDGNGDGSGDGNGDDGTDSDDPSDGGSEEPVPDDPTDPTGPPTDPAQDVPAAVERLHDGMVIVTAGETVTDGFQVRVETDGGAPVPNTRVLYAVSDSDDATDVRFAGGDSKAETTTNAEGVAAAPELLAGERTGTFTVKAIVTGHDEVAPVEFTAMVEAPKADTLERVGGEGTLTAQAGEVCPNVQILATHGGRAAAAVPVTATVLAADGATLEDGTGPYFKPEGEDGRTHTLKDLKTNAEGKLTVPPLNAGSQPGTYRLKLTTADGGKLVLEIEITEADAPAEPSSSPEPSPS